MSLLVLESDRQKATFWSSEKLSKAAGGQRLNNLESEDSLEAHGLQRCFCVLASLQYVHSNEAGSSASVSST